VCRWESVLCVLCDCVSESRFCGVLLWLGRYEVGSQSIGRVNVS
jgi:hypothetical protein